MVKKMLIIVSMVALLVLIVATVGATSSKLSTTENEIGAIEAPEEVKDYNPNIDFKVSSKLNPDEQFKIKIISEEAMNGISLRYLDFEDVSYPIYSSDLVCTPVVEENWTDKDKLNPDNPPQHCVTESSIVGTVKKKQEVWRNLPLETTAKTKERNNDITTYEFKSKNIDIFSQFRLAFWSAVGSLYKYSINAYNSLTRSILLDPWVNTTAYANYFNSTNWAPDSGYNFSFPGVNISATNCTLPNSTIGINQIGVVNGSNGSIYAAFTIGASLQNHASSGCTATAACGSQGGYETEYINDGSNTTRHATSSCSVSNPWIRLTCTKNITVTQITIVGPPHMGGQANQGYFLSFQDSTGAWLKNLTWAFNVTPGETGDDVRYNYFLPEPITSTVFRLNAALPVAIDYGRINEFWLYNASFYNSSVISDKIVADQSISSVTLDAIDDNKGGYGCGINYSVSSDGLSWTSIDKGVNTAFVGGTDIYWKADFIIGSDTRLTPIIYDVILTPSFLVNGMGYSNSSINDTFVNYLDNVVARTHWVSNSSLAGFIFNSNASGLWRNETYNNTFNPSNFSYSTMIVNVTHQRTIGWRFYTNDSFGTNIETPIYTFNVLAPTDTTPPYSWGNKTSSIRWNSNVVFQVNWTDTESTLGGFVFNTNASGAWVNSSFNNTFSSENTSYATAYISVPNGTDVGWRFYANDSAGNRNQTEIFRFTANASNYNTIFIYPTDALPLLVIPGVDRNIGVTFAFTQDLVNLTSALNWTNITIGNNQAFVYNMRNLSQRECNQQGYGLYESTVCSDNIGCHEDDEDGTMDKCEDGMYCGGALYEYVNNIFLNATTISYNETIKVTCEFRPDPTYYTGDDYAIVYNNGTKWRTVSSGAFTTGVVQNKSVVFAVDNITGVHYARCAIGYAESSPTTTCYTDLYSDNDDLAFNVTNQRLEYSANHGWDLNFTLPPKNLSGRQDMMVTLQYGSLFVESTDSNALDYGSVRWVLNSNTTNDTSPSYLDVVVFGLNWTTTGSRLAGFVFSTNASGAWVNSSFNTSFNTYNTSYASATIGVVKNKDISWRFYTNDTLGYLNMSDTFNLSVSNSIPAITTISILPASPKENQNLSCNYTYIDVDGDAITSYFDWYKNGEPQNISSINLTSGNTTYNQVWGCGVKLFDGTSNSTQSNATNVTIADGTAPTLENLSISVTSGYTDETVTINASCGDSISALTAGYPYMQTLDPNGAKVNYTMTNSAGNNYYKSQILNIKGTWNISFYCMDGNNNMASNTSTGLTYLADTRPSSGGTGPGGSGSSYTQIINQTTTITGGFCGNNKCEEGEDGNSCPQDCKADLDDIFCFIWDSPTCPSWKDIWFTRAIAITFVAALLLIFINQRVIYTKKKKRRLKNEQSS